ncbi:MAG: hypothetical protein QIT35_gp55 [Methanophagales virus PBV299]|uniref:Terminase large subunit n=1 Tax=Methanophagales virus PBV299 TaxID=2987730 RepID=A0ABY6GLG8_9CAUD|nr:MAG: hypothetical protein QIT35_gp55 [Methanophagales virus PBV299]UYL64851.1 MAG: hypothetical protein OFDIEDLO_00055 [Methanophagales virus PBV299]
MKTVKEKAIRQCAYCGKEIKRNRIFCSQHAKPPLLNVWEIFHTFGLEPRGFQLEALLAYMKMRLGFERRRRLMIKVATGAGKSFLLDMIALIELTHFPDSFGVIGSISLNVAKEHILRIRGWIKHSPYRVYLGHESTFSKEEIWLQSPLNTRLLAIAQSEETRTGYHPNYLLIDEIGRMRSRAYWGLFYQMGKSKDVIEVMASTPFVSSDVFYQLWSSDDTVRISPALSECWWIPRYVIENARRTLPPEMFQLLYEARFRTITDRVFDEEMILANIIDFNVKPSDQLVMGIDLARRVDESAVVVYDLAQGVVVHAETFTGEWDAQIERIVQLIERWKPIKIILDRGGPGDVIANELAGYPIEAIYISGKEKQKLVQNAQLMFLRNQVKFNPHTFPKLADQLSGFVYLNEDRTSFGPYTKSLHDDLVDALLLALSFASKKVNVVPLDEDAWKPIRKMPLSGGWEDIRESKWMIETI